MPDSCTTRATFHPRVLDIDCAAEAARIEEALRRQVSRELRRRGAVVGVSGGVDSALCLTLAVRALGASRVRGLLMPGRNTSPESTALGRRLCGMLGVECREEPISPVIEALGGYARRDEAIRSVCPAYVPGDGFKIAVADDVLGSDRLNFFNLIVRSRDGTVHKHRLPVGAYLTIVATTNLKQRTRTMLEYFHAEELNYAVVGTPNKLEFDQGFFVRGGDGLADLKPIAHLYKTQVFAMAEHLGVPKEITSRPPTTDTYSLPQTQEEFYFALPHRMMDLVLYAYIHRVPESEVARVLGLTLAQVGRAFRDIEAKRRASRLLHQHALTVDETPRTEMAE